MTRWALAPDTATDDGNAIAGNVPGATRVFRFFLNTCIAMVLGKDDAKEMLVSALDELHVTHSKVIATIACQEPWIESDEIMVHTAAKPLSPPRLNR